MGAEEELTKLIDMYYDERAKYLTLIKSIPQQWEQTKINLNQYPEARTFLHNEKNVIHQASLAGLYRLNLGGRHLDNAGQFLNSLQPRNESAEVNDKQAALIDDLTDWYEKCRGVSVGVNAIIKLIKKEKPEPAMSEEELKARGRSWLESTAEDEKFLGAYRLHATVKWYNYAGLWPYVVEPKEGPESEYFYSGVSDFTLCMIDGITELERSLKETRAAKLN
jgi:hypothetical protein